MKNTYESLCRTLENLDDLALTTMPVILFTGNGYPDDVTVQSTASLGSLHKDIILRILDNNEGETFSGHLDLTCNLWENLFLFFISSAARTGTFSF